VQFESVADTPNVTGRLNLVITAIRGVTSHRQS